MVAQPTLLVPAKLDDLGYKGSKVGRGKSGHFARLG